MKRSLTILILATITVVAYSQNDSVSIRPLVPSVPTKSWINHYLYAETSWGSYSHIRTANNGSYYGNQDTLCRTSFGIGLHTEIQFVSLHKTDRWGDMSLLEMYMNGNTLAINIGYSYDHFSFQQDRWSNAGIHTHWLSVEVAVYGFRFVLLGFKSNMFLGSTSVCRDGWSYNGINSDCFNHFTFEPVMGIRLTYTNLFMEIRMGTDVGGKLNLKRMAYYNQVTSQNYSDTDLFLEIRVGFRNFTTANKTL